MNNATHTPGKWKIEGELIRAATDDGDVTVAIVRGWLPEFSDEEYANKCLIIAAPDYYQGCKDLPQITDDEPTSVYDKRVLSWFYNNAGKIHAANNKARGIS